jgi:hypothetical protein
VLPNPKNRRLEERRNLESEVLLSFDDPVHHEVSAHLVDYSKSGFRAVHEYSALCTGQVVRFERMVACGCARVVWNRILGEKVETGFVVL